tara:strand:- start:571 stop:1533 length:963 start_codon:yes stop_codon:yes gene_type:complete
VFLSGRMVRKSFITSLNNQLPKPTPLIFTKVKSFTRHSSSFTFKNSFQFNSNDKIKDEFSIDDKHILKVPAGHFYSLSEHGQEINDRSFMINDELKRGNLISKIHFVKMNDSFSFVDDFEKLVLLYQIFPIVKQAVSDREFLQFNEFFDILNMYVDYGVNLDQILSLFFKQHVPDIYFSKVKMITARIVNSDIKSREFVHPIILNLLDFDPSFFNSQSFNFDDEYLDFYKYVFIHIQHIKNLKSALIESHDLVSPDYLRKENDLNLFNKKKDLISWIHSDQFLHSNFDENIIKYFNILSQLELFYFSYGNFLSKENFILD